MENETQEKTTQQRFARPESKVLFDYWNALRNSRPAPLRTEVNPCAIKRILPSVFILQRHDRDHIVFRLAGTRLCAAYGREFRDQNVLSLFSGQSRTAFRNLTNAVIEQSVVGHATCRAWSLSKEHVDAEILLLPLADENGDITRILGSTFVWDHNFPSYWQTLVRQQITRTEIIHKYQSDMIPANDTKQHDSSELRRPFLYLVKSD